MVSLEKFLGLRHLAHMVKRDRNELGWPRVDVLNFDIEAVELDIPRGSAARIDGVGAVLVEIHANTGPKEVQPLLRPRFRLEKTGQHLESTCAAVRV